ncbi:MAG: lytic transglycosylase domain-containing protein [Candidatus Aminicenantes bacterium]|nr:lytic transglycosylase domain-containing protein [Candidatus Aminicenantes bacterium]
MGKDLIKIVSLAIFLGFVLLHCPVLAEQSAREKYDPIVKKLAVKHGVPADFVHAVIKAESNYDQFAVSEKGALGLMQLMPETAIKYGVLNVFDPEQNIEGGIKYLKDLIKKYKGDRNLVLAAYNAGQMAVEKHNGVPPYPETKNYLKRVEYRNPYIKTKTIIYRFYDENGRLCLTNNPYYLPKK